MCVLGHPHLRLHLTGCTHSFSKPHAHHIRHPKEAVDAVHMVHKHCDAQLKEGLQPGGGTSTDGGMFSWKCSTGHYCHPTPEIQGSSVTPIRRRAATFWQHVAFAHKVALGKACQGLSLPWLPLHYQFSIGCAFIISSTLKIPQGHTHSKLHNWQPWVASNNRSAAYLTPHKYLPPD
eukprot:1143920-Pelagomonas_calceolata.AAC.3